MRLGLHKIKREMRGREKKKEMKGSHVTCLSNLPSLEVLLDLEEQQVPFCKAPVSSATVNARLPVYRKLATCQGGGKKSYLALEIISPL